jgi:hypothetical protein
MIDQITHEDRLLALAISSLVYFYPKTIRGFLSKFPGRILFRCADYCIASNTLSSQIMLSP